MVILTEQSNEEINRFGGKRGNITMNIDKVRMGPSGIIVDIMYDKDPNLGSLKAGEAANRDGEINLNIEIVPVYT